MDNLSIISNGGGSEQERDRQRGPKELTWECSRCDRSFSDDDASFETSNGDYVCQGCMEALEAQAEMMEER